MRTLTRHTLLLFWQHAVRHKLTLLIISIGVVLTVANDLVKPFLIRNLFNALTISDPNQASTIVNVIYWILGVSLLNTVLWRVVGFANNYFQPRVMSDLMNTCYRYIHQHSNAFFDNNFVGSIVTRVRRLSRSFESFMDNLVFNIARTALKSVAILVVLILYKPLIGLAMLVWIVIYVGFSFVFAHYKLPYDIEKAKQDTKTTGHLADTVTNHQNIKLFTAYRREVGSFEKISDQLFRLRKKAWDLGQIGDTFQSLSMVALEFVVLYTAYHYWKQGALTIGDFALLQAYLIDLFAHLWDIGRYIRTTYESIADGNEMTAMLVQPHSIVDVKDAKQLLVTKGAIAFRRVDFHYFAQQPILDQFSLDIKAGERVALVGRSGGGKSTIVKTLFRFVDVQGGSIEIDGQNISQVTQESLREQISLVPQEPMLFHRSLMENIRYGQPSATDEAVYAAAKAAHCHEFIDKFEHKYDTLVGERGVKLSGGERQRVAIARAILKNAPVLVLDEATSSLDSESETYIQDALQNLMKGKTTIVIAHRLSTIRKMDRIIVLDDGRIIEQGKHEELLKAEQGTYQKLWDIQVGGFLANEAVS